MNLINDNNLKSLEVNQVNANMDVVHGLINSDTVIGERKAADIILYEDAKGLSVSHNRMVEV